MIITSVLGSGFWPQEAEKKTANETNNSSRKSRHLGSPKPEA
jgi:hypothetical protein